MIYDCFTFFNELDLLEIRLNILANTVDKFVIAEANRNFVGQPRKLCLADHLERFQRFADKIIYLPITDVPDSKSSWDVENFQRNALARGLQNAKDDDIIIISDLDEIPNPDTIKNYRPGSGIKCLEQYLCYYYLNTVDLVNVYWYKAKIMSGKDFHQDCTDWPYRPHPAMVPELNISWTANKIRCLNDCPNLPDGGWHFTYLESPEQVAAKLQAYSHQEFNNAENTNLTKIARRRRNGNHPTNRHLYNYPRAPQSFLPQYILDHLEQYQSFLYPGKPSLVMRYHWLLARLKKFFYSKHRDGDIRTVKICKLFTIKYLRSEHL